MFAEFDSGYFLYFRFRIVRLRIRCAFSVKCSKSFDTYICTAVINSKVSPFCSVWTCKTLSRICIYSWSIFSFSCFDRNRIICFKCCVINNDCEFAVFLNFLFIESYCCVSRIFNCSWSNFNSVVFKWIKSIVILNNINFVICVCSRYIESCTVYILFFFNRSKNVCTISFSVVTDSSCHSIRVILIDIVAFALIFCKVNSVVCSYYCIIIWCPIVSVDTHAFTPAVSDEPCSVVWRSLTEVFLWIVVVPTDNSNSVVTIKSFWTIVCPFSLI